MAWKWWTGFFAVVAVALAMTAYAYLVGLPRIFWAVHGFDKLVHFMVAGLLAFFLDGALRRRALFVVSGFAMPAAAVLVLVPSGIDEYLQRYADLRSSSIWDFAADVAGVVVLITISRRVAA